MTHSPHTNQTNQSRATPHAPSSGGGFTLLELILAIAVFASMTTLIAAIYANAHAIAHDATRNATTLTLQRVTDLARDQWLTRTDIAFNPKEQSSQPDAADTAQPAPTTGPGSPPLIPDSTAAFTPLGVAFYTTTPILFPDTPIVRASYRVEPLDRQAGDTEPRARLLYTEQRIRSFDRPPGLAEPAPDGSPDAGTIVLLDRVENLRLQRFGPELPPPDIETQSATDTTTQTQDTRTAEQREQLWRDFPEPFAATVNAVRFIGSHNGEHFTCTFARTPSP